MVDVPSARKYGFELKLHEGPLRDILNGPAVQALVAELGDTTAQAVAAHVRAVADADDAENYVDSMVVERTTSDALGIAFDGPFELGNRPAATVAIPPGRGVNPDAKPPLMVEAETHALTSVPGFALGQAGEDIR